MGYWVIKRCPKCGSVLYAGRARIGLGAPFDRCPECRQLVRRTDTTEWELLSLGGKAWHIICNLYTLLFMAMPVLLLALAVDYICNNRIKWLRDTGNLLLVLGIGLGLSGVLGTCLFWKEIKESKDRMADPEYRRVLRTLGLLKN